MKNQDQLPQNPLHMHLDVMADIRKRYNRKEYGYIKKLISCLNTNNEIVVDNIRIDSSELKTMLGISKRTATILARKLILDDIMQINIQNVDNRFVRIMVLSNYVAFIDDPFISNTFEDISAGLRPLPGKKITI